MKETVPPWVIFHIPHDSSFIPPQCRKKILLSDEELNRELLCMCDLWTLALYGNGIPFSQIVASPVSRLVVDVERFSEDKEEVMAQRGMGVIYTTTHRKKPLRLKPDAAERQMLLERWYRPHHFLLSLKVNEAINKFGKACVVDLHSFASKALPYEMNSGPRPEICIGTDSFHTPQNFKEAFHFEFSKNFDTGYDSPFSGALVPLERYKKDKRVASVMVETRRDLYENELTGELLSSFVKTSKILQHRLLTAIHNAL